MTLTQSAPRLSYRSTFILVGCVLLTVTSLAHYFYPRIISSNRPFSHNQVDGVGRQSANSVSANTLQRTLPEESRPRLVADWGKLPLVFEKNQGQTDPKVEYLARGSGYTLFLTSTGAVLSLGGRREQLPKHTLLHPMRGFAKSKEPQQSSFRPSISSSTDVRMRIVGANPNPKLAASEVQPGVTNYFMGKDPRNWHTNVPQYARVEYQDIYSGIDLAFHGEQQHLEFDFIVAAFADPAPINLHFTGVSRVITDNSGDLILSTSAGDFTLGKPLAYQERNGVRQRVAARFVVRDGDQIRVSLGEYDSSRKLIIDPTLLYSTYLGGAGDDAGFGITVDNLGDAYVTGTTNSASFPGASGRLAGGFDAFVTKLNANGSAILYSTFLGGGSDDGGTSIKVDSSFNVYIAGNTSSSDFPVTAGAAQMAFGGAQDGFVAKLNSTGSVLTYATYIGGNGSDSASAIAIDGSGNAYVGGGTQSFDFPTTPGAFQTTTDGQDGFITKLDAAGTKFLYSTYLGGSSDNGFDIVRGIALMPGCVSSCNSFVVGEATSGNFPLKNAYDSTFQSDDAFVTELNSLGSALVYSTFLGGDDIDDAFGIAVDSSGAAYVTGYTLSDNFPVVNAFQPELHGFADGFVAKFSPDGSKLSYSSYLGSGDEGGLSIAVDSRGNAYVVGTSRTNLFPLVDPIQSTLNGDSDAFVTMIDPTGATMIYSTYLGGDGDENYKQPTGDLFGGIAIGPSDAVYLTGRTTSMNGFPTASPFQASSGGGVADAYVVKIAPAPATPELSIGVFPNAVGVSSGATTPSIAVTGTPLNGFSGSVELACKGLPAHAACHFGPTSLTSLPGISSLTVSTNDASAQVVPQANRPNDPLFVAILPITGLVMLGCGLAFSEPRKRTLITFLLCTLLLSGLFLLSACGGGSDGNSGGGGGGSGGSRGGGNSPATPPGTYSITVTGTSGTSSHNAILILAVQ